jgi:NAD(P)-dependent dehydrogenase (short-subunit alcohol dehydrogenase family)
MEGKVIVVTGASDGIGAVAARALHNKGAEVVVVGRSPEKTKKVAGALGAQYFLADFTKLGEVRQLAEKLKSSYPKIDVLINNAGGIFGTRELTADGHEKTLQVNHLAPFLLTNLLLDNLIKSKASVINTSSIANVRYGNIDINDLDLEHGFSPNRAYGNAKLANILFTKALHARYKDKGISAVAVHPGVIATNFASNTTSPLRFIYRMPILSKLILESPEKGADPLIWLASTSPNKDWQSGEYYEKHKLGKLNPQALDTKLINAFWDKSEQFTNKP